MRKVLIFAIAGFLAQLVDGSLGMGFGASSSILLTYGIAGAWGGGGVGRSGCGGG